MLDDARVVACQAELADAAPRAPCPDAERLTLETVCRFAVVRGLSTAGGLAMFDPRTEKFRNYDVSDGLQSGAFNQGA